MLSSESLRWPEVDTSQDFFRPLARLPRTKTDELKYEKERDLVFSRSQNLARELHNWISTEEGRAALTEFSTVAGITFRFDLEGLRRSKLGNLEMPAFEFHSVRPARRIGPDGTSLNQLILSFVQTRDVPLEDDSDETFRFRGGSTLILDRHDEAEIRDHEKHSRRGEVRKDPQIPVVNDDRGRERSKAGGPRYLPSPGC